MMESARDLASAPYIASTTTPTLIEDCTPTPDVELNGPHKSDPDPYPELSAFLTAHLQPGKRAHLPTLNKHLSKKTRENFVSTQLAPNVQAQLDQPFGKDTIDCCFKSEVSLRHVLLPLQFSGCLDKIDWATV